MKPATINYIINFFSGSKPEVTGTEAGITRVSPAGGGRGRKTNRIISNSNQITQIKYPYFTTMSIPEDNQYYNKQLRPLAIGLRKNMTKAEACLWKYVLRAGMMKEYTFKKQRPVLNYIGDFVCTELNLVIEVDGLTHDFGDVQAKDDQKQKDLEEAGFTVMRFTDAEVLNNINGVFQSIWNWIEEFEKKSN